MKVFAYASRLDGYYAHFLSSMEKARLEYIVHLEHQRDWSWSRMVDFQEAMAAQYPDEPMIFMDLWDCLFVGDPGELESLIRCSPPKLQSARTCWPEPPKADIIDSKYAVASPWRYVNGSGPFGYGKDILNAIRHGKVRYPIRPMDRSRHPHDFPHNDNDQRFYTDLYIDGVVALDHQCDVVQCLPGLKPGELEYRDGRIHNLVTGSQPQFLHAANRTWDIIPAEVLRDKSMYIH